MSYRAELLNKLQSLKKTVSNELDSSSRLVFSATDAEINEVYPVYKQWVALVDQQFAELNLEAGPEIPAVFMHEPYRDA